MDQNRLIGPRFFFLCFTGLLGFFLAASGSGGLGLAIANKDKAGKASESEEVSLHRERQRQCDSMAPFEGSFVYQGGSGCGGNAFEVSITCEDKGRKEEQHDGLMCTFFEKTVVSLCDNL